MYIYNCIQWIIQFNTKFNTYVNYKKIFFSIKTKIQNLLNYSQNLPLTY